ncbi:uncharacterized protein LOC143079363 [Mytilus galloprovincialis]|uniref:uncharacterized protein LOC143079363 n=1 Tax=Mytilus galloprovincialis TaxID=29158 RepID=UPI003F7B7B3D
MISERMFQSVCVLVIFFSQRTFTSAFDPYTKQARLCNGVVIWPAKPLLPTRNIGSAERFPREKAVHDFIEDLEVLVNESRTGIYVRSMSSAHTRHKRSTHVPDSDVLDKVCNDKKDTGNPWDEDLPSTAYRMLRGFMGICNDQDQTNEETVIQEQEKRKRKRSDTVPVHEGVTFIPSHGVKDVTPAKKKKKKKKKKKENVKKYQPAEVLTKLKEKPFNKPEAKVWDFVEPDNTAKMTPADDTHPDVKIIKWNGGDFVDPHSSKVVSFGRRKRSTEQIFTLRNVDHTVSGHSACLPHYELFWFKDIVEYMDDMCWVLGKFSRKSYYSSNCMPGVCHASNPLFRKQSHCYPGKHSTHVIWFYCPNLEPGERYRKMAFNLAHNCECRTC